MFILVHTPLVKFDCFLLKCLSIFVMFVYVLYAWLFSIRYTVSILFSYLSIASFYGQFVLVNLFHGNGRVFMSIELFISEFKFNVNIFVGGGGDRTLRRTFRTNSNRKYLFYSFVLTRQALND